MLALTGKLRFGGPASVQRLLDLLVERFLTEPVARPRRRSRP
jgi:hypothetical protein